MADSKLSALTAVSVPAVGDFIYGIDSGPNSLKYPLDRVLGTLLPHTCQGRLTLTTATPVTTADVTTATTIFFTPFRGNQISLYDGTRWRLYTFSEISLALGTLTASKPYDVFIYDNSGTLTLEFLVWTDTTTRATALVTQNGILCKTGALTRRYLGTFYTISTTATADSGGGTTTQVGGKRLLYNYYNRVKRNLSVFDSTDSWTYATNTWRSGNNNAGNRVEFLIGVQEDAVDASLTVMNASVTGSVGAASIALDSTSTQAANFTGFLYGNQEVDTVLSSTYNKYPGVGYHYLQWIEKSLSGTSTFYGDPSGTHDRQSGLTASVWC